MDYGSDWEYYTSDITRTWPVSRGFTAEQEKMDRCVLEARNAIIAAMKPGATLTTLKDAAEQVYARHGYRDEFLGTGRYIVQRGADTAVSRAEDPSPAGGHRGTDREGTGKPHRRGAGGPGATVRTDPGEGSELGPRAAGDEPIGTTRPNAGGPRGSYCWPRPRGPYTAVVLHSFGCRQPRKGCAGPVTARLQSCGKPAFAQNSPISIPS
ncbi:MAG: M24 family metallopeptidase [Gemmatimonadales bacterium]|nr:M24 family metallopeptidase [Gemmatimonadales bacterium]